MKTPLAGDSSMSARVWVERAPPHIGREPGRPVVADLSFGRWDAPDLPLRWVTMQPNPNRILLLRLGQLSALGIMAALGLFDVSQGGLLTGGYEVVGLFRM